MIVKNDSSLRSKKLHHPNMGKQLLVKHEQATFSPQRFNGIVPKTVEPILGNQRIVSLFKYFKTVETSFR